MSAQRKVVVGAETFDNPATAIVTRCEQSGVILWVEKDGRIKAKGNREAFNAWQTIIKRHKLGVIAVLTEQSQPTIDTAYEDAVLKEDYLELTLCIIELCQLAEFSAESRTRMLAARRNLYPFQYAIECAYFRWQIERAKAGVYWNDDLFPT